MFFFGFLEKNPFKSGLLSKKQKGSIGPQNAEIYNFGLIAGTFIFVKWGKITNVGKAAMPKCHLHDTQ